MTLTETRFVCDKPGNPIAALSPLSLYEESARLHEQHFDVRSSTDSLGADHNRVLYTSLAFYQPHPRLEIRRHRVARNDSLLIVQRRSGPAGAQQPRFRKSAL